MFRAQAGLGPSARRHGSDAAGVEMLEGVHAWELLSRLARLIAG